jgi:hypothetical protein
MGFDLNGIAPHTEKGIYFRNNVWWWRPLAEYVLAVCDDIIPESERMYWQSNDGQKVSGETALSISQRLSEHLDSGATKRFSDKHAEDLAAMPRHQCEYCNGTGDRPDLGPPEWKAKCGGCNVCHGTGEVEDRAASYPFSEDNVRDFAQFCAESGGFEIY